MSNLNIIDPRLSFSSLTKRATTTYLVIHHAAAENTSVQTIHKWHKGKGWAGIGYNFYIRQDGTIYKGRGWENIGAHTKNYNSRSVGICFEGNFDSTSKSMPNSQYNSGAAIIAAALEKYPAIYTICGHKSLDSTACPGQYFPLDKLIAAGKSGDVSSVLSVTDSKSASSDTDLNGCPYGNCRDTVKNGSRGTTVCRCQWYLNKSSYASLTIDGICGSKTAAVIKAFQSSKKLSVDGVCGPKTWDALESALLVQSSCNSINAGVESAIEILAGKGVISTAGYWYANYGKLKYLDQLLIKMSAMSYKSAVSAAISTVENAVEKLEMAGVINSPDYWITNYSKLQYVDELLIKAANRL